MPVWLRAVTRREGDDIVTQCCIVAEGQFFPVTVRVNVPALLSELRSLGIVPTGQDAVSGFGSFLKKAVKAVTKNKIVKAVGKVAKKVARNPLVQIANPALAITTHTTSRALGGKGTIKGKLGKAVDFGTKLTTSAVPAASAAPGMLSHVSPKAVAALGVGLKTASAARFGGQVAAAAKLAQSQVARGRAAASLVTQGKLSKVAAAPLIQAATKAQAAVKKAAPALAKKAVASSKIKTQLAAIAQASRAGNAEAKLAASVIARSSRALDDIAKIQSQAGAGIPGLLVTASGKIVKAPRGRFRLANISTGRDLLYTGPGKTALKGTFTAVAGPAWGGERDPGNDIEGPFNPIRHPEGRWLLDTVGALTP